ncbi:MAG TPA: tautomerase family protein [Methanoregulaceae archaeon]|nr:tautomerase family protein [Methanoregulaceae archaeon]
MPVVIIKMAKGRTTAQKRTMVKEFTHIITETLGVGPEMVTILIDELELENIGRSGILLSETK